MKSMTGYGTSHFFSSDISIDVRLRSVNSRFLEIRFYLPEEYLIFEPDLRKMIAQRVLRGNLDLRVRRQELNAVERLECVTSLQLAKDWLRACESLSKDLNIKMGDVTVQGLVKSVEAIKCVPKNSVIDPREREILFAEVEKVLESCCKEREREGLRLREDLRDNLKGLQKFIQFAEDLREEANQKLEERFHQRLTSLGLLSSLDPQRWGQEVALQIEKSDINEELVRLKEHVRNLTEILAKDKGASGRKLDFYTQELLREINTIGSKSHMSRLTQLIVDAKITIERIKEQVQNIE